MSATREYTSRRNWKRTPEPKAGRPRRSAEGPMWVLQEHDASSRHFDLRLEREGVLASWAVPKGPSLDPREKRLAMPTEDHPIEYADFEGTIPEGEYGAGTVIVWDRGIYENLTIDSEGEEVPVSHALEQGHVKVRLDGGRKIGGAFALTRMGGGARERWLMVKIDDDQADARRNPVSTKRESVSSGRTIEQVAREDGGG